MTALDRFLEPGSAHAEVLDRLAEVSDFTGTSLRLNQVKAFVRDLRLLPAGVRPVLPPKIGVALIDGEFGIIGPTIGFTGKPLPNGKYAIPFF